MQEIHDNLNAKASRQSFWSVALFVFTFAMACSGLVVALWPEFGFSQMVSTTMVFAQLLAFPLATGAGLIVVGFIAFGLCWRRRSRLLAAVVSLTVALVGIALIVFPHGLPQSLPPSEGNFKRVLTVVTFNSGSMLTNAVFQELLDEVTTDVIVLPETTLMDAKRVAGTVGFDSVAFEPLETGFTRTYDGQIAPTTILINRTLGEAKQLHGPATSFGTVAIEFEDPSLPIILGIHSAPPLPGLMEQWRKDVSRVVEFAESSNKPIILAGDFNATLRHGKLAARAVLIDSQEHCSHWQTGTWPAQLPNFLRTPIDHILVSPSMKTRSCQSILLKKSDHLAYSTEVSVR